MFIKDEIDNYILGISISITIVVHMNMLVYDKLNMPVLFYNYWFLKVYLKKIVYRFILYTTAISVHMKRIEKCNQTCLPSKIV